MSRLPHQFRDKRLQLPRAEWSVEHFQIAIAELRRDATSMRSRAEWKDKQADDLRQDAAKLATDNLPMFEGLK